jgi:WD40 repeat protein
MVPIHTPDRAADGEKSNKKGSPCNIELFVARLFDERTGLSNLAINENDWEIDSDFVAQNESSEQQEGEFSPEKTLREHTVYVRSVAFSSDGLKIVIGSDVSTVKIWDLVTGKVKTLTGHTDLVKSAAFSNDDTKVVSCGVDKKIIIWDVAIGQVFKTLNGHYDVVNSVAFNHDDTKIVSGSDDKTVKIWDLDTGYEVMTLLGHTGEVVSVALSRDGERVVSGSSDATVRIWDLKTRREDMLFRHSSRVLSVAFSNDGKRLVSGSEDMTVKIWNLVTRKEEMTLEGHTDVVRSVAFSSDGKMVVSGSNDNIAKIWDAATGQEDQTLKGNTKGVSSVAFSSDGKKVVSGSGDGIINIWYRLPAKTKSLDEDIPTVKGTVKGEKKLAATRSRGLFQGSSNLECFLDGLFQDLALPRDRRTIEKFGKEASLICEERSQESLGYDSDPFTPGVGQEDARVSRSRRAAGVTQSRLDGWRDGLAPHSMRNCATRSDKVSNVIERFLDMLCDETKERLLTEKINLESLEQGSKSA